MNRISEFVVRHGTAAWLLFISVTLVFAVLVAGISRQEGQEERLRHLSTVADRAAVELLSLTLNGGVMGSVSLIGLIDQDAKADALQRTTLNSPRIMPTLESVSLYYGAQGVFIVGGDGIVRSSWDATGKPSTSLDVSFRPYFKMAMQGQETIYAAVSLARGDRALYFGAPVLDQPVRSGKPVGVVVARTSTDTIDAAMLGKSDIALLLSPQGVVFTSSRRDLIGTLAGEPTPERLEAIRALRQFGAMFEDHDPPPLPFSAEPGFLWIDGNRFALAKTPIAWNDPSGDWSLVLIEDLSRTVAPRDYLRAGVVAGMVFLLVGLITLSMLRGQYRQMETSRRLADLAAAQRADADRKSRMAEAGLKFQQAGSIGEVATLYFAEARSLIGALQGTLYTFDREGSSELVLAGAYACGTAPPLSLMAGEGLLGQCAIDRGVRTVEAPDDQFWIIRSGLGEASPGAVIMSAVELNSKILGVVEVAILSMPDPERIQRFKELTTLLALNIEIRSRTMSPGIEYQPTSTPQEGSHVHR